MTNNEAYAIFHKGKGLWYNGSGCWSEQPRLFKKKGTAKGAVTSSCGSRWVAANIEQLELVKLETVITERASWNHFL